MSLFESVPNLSTAEPRIVCELAKQLMRAPDVRLIHATSDARQNRTVFTALGEPGALLDALVALGRRTTELVDLSQHSGAHPRVGVLDVVPLVSMAPEGTPEDAVNGSWFVTQVVTVSADLEVTVAGAGSARGPVYVTPPPRPRSGPGSPGWVPPTKP